MLVACVVSAEPDAATPGLLQQMQSANAEVWRDWFPDRGSLACMQLAQEQEVLERLKRLYPEHQRTVERYGMIYDQYKVPQQASYLCSLPTLRVLLSQRHGIGSRCCKPPQPP